MENEHIVDVAYPANSSIPTPVPFYEPLSDSPTGVVATPKTPSIKVTPLSPEVKIKRNAVVASHWLNLPLKEGTFYVADVYKTLATMAFNYQREHTDAFFDQYPGLLIIPAGATRPTTDDLRANYKWYCMRAANRLFHYDNGIKMLVGSLANLAILSRLNGQAEWKQISRAFRLANILGATNVYSAFPKPDGLEEYVINYSRYGVGLTNYFADIVSVPLWITDIWGNRGDHSMAFSDLVYKTQQECYLNVGQSGAGVQLADNLFDIAVLYGQKNVASSNEGATSIGVNNYVTQKLRRETATSSDWSDTTFNNVPNAIPTMPKVENGSVFAMVKNETNGGFIDKVPFILSTSANNTDYRSFLTVSGVNTRTDNLINKIWDNYAYWQKYMMTYFSDFTDPESDWNQIFQQSLKMLVPSMKVDPFVSKVRLADGFDMQSLSDQMIYKRDNNVNTATLIKWLPIIDAGLIDNNEYIPADLDNTSANFMRNYERYNPVDVSPAEYLDRCKSCPKLTPSVLENQATSGNQLTMRATGEMPFTVMNATDAYEQYCDNSGKTYGTGIWESVSSKNAFVMMGRHLTDLDMVCAANIASDNNEIDTLGISSDFAKDFVKTCDAIVIEEYPIQPFTMTQRLIDNTDPFQCGFNVIKTFNAGLPNVWDEAFGKSSKHFRVSSVDYDANSTRNDIYTLPDAQFDNANSDCTNPTWSRVNPSSSTNQLFNRMHTTNDEYMESIIHAFIFVGSGIFKHPVQKGIGSLAAGSPKMNMLAFNIYNTEVNSSGTPVAPSGDFATVKGAICTAAAAVTSSPAVSPSGNPAVVDYWIRFAMMSVDHGNMNANIYKQMYNEHMVMKHVLAEMSSRVLTQGDSLEFSKYLFNPEYGPVSIFSYAPPVDAAFGQNLLCIGDHNCINQISAYVGTDNAKIACKLYGACKGGTQAVGDYKPAQTRVPIAWSPDNVGMWYLWFIDQFYYTYFTVSRYGEVVRDSARSSGKSGFSSLTKAPATFFARNTVNWPGVEDTIPFWSHERVDKQITANADIKTTAFTRTNDLVVVPFVKSKNIDARKPDDRGKVPHAPTSPNDVVAKAFNPSPTTDPFMAKSFAGGNDRSDRDMVKKGKSTAGRKGRFATRGKDKYANGKRDNVMDESDKKTDKMVKDIPEPAQSPQLSI